MLSHPVFKVGSYPDVELALPVTDIDVPEFASFHRYFQMMTAPNSCRASTDMVKGQDFPRFARDKLTARFSSTTPESNYKRASPTEALL